MFGKTQFSPKIANRLKCKWLLRSSFPSPSKEVHLPEPQEKDPSSLEGVQNKNNTSTNSEECTQRNNTKRKWQNTSKFFEAIRSEFEREKSKLENKIFDLKKTNKEISEMLQESKNDNSSLHDTLLKSAEK